MTGNKDISTSFDSSFFNQFVTLANDFVSSIQGTSGANATFSLSLSVMFYILKFLICC